MNKKVKFTAIGLLVLITAGCNQAPKKTDSMIRRETANAESLTYIVQARQLVTESTFKNPSAHLDELVMIQNLLRESRQVYREAKITDLESPGLSELESRLLSINKPLALASLNAFDVAIEKSIAFKQKKTDVESLPVYDNSVAKRALYSHLEKFNSDLETCCLDKILMINRFLRSEEEKYYDVIKLGHNTLHYMGMLIRREISEETLREKLQAAKLTIKNNQSISTETTAN